MRPHRGISRLSPSHALRPCVGGDLEYVCSPLFIPLFVPFSCLLHIGGMSTTHTNFDLCEIVENLNEADIRSRISELTAKYEAEVEPLTVLLRAAQAKRRAVQKAVYLQGLEEVQR